MSSSYLHKDSMGKNLVKITGFRFSDKTIPKKMDVIAKSHNRNRNQETEWALKQYIEAYEKEHGKIIIQEEE